MALTVDYSPEAYALRRVDLRWVLTQGLKRNGESVSLNLWIRAASSTGYFLWHLSTRLCVFDS
jgi:hypothetical protein